MRSCDGLENHWGLGRDAVGVIRIIKAINSPWLRATLDTGNFLENQYEQYEAMAPFAAFVQAKTYGGNGKWYTLDIDYDRVASILKKANYRGYISLEFEGKGDYEVEVPGVWPCCGRLLPDFERSAEAGAAAGSQGAVPSETLKPASSAPTALPPNRHLPRPARDRTVRQPIGRPRFRSGNSRFAGV